MALLYKVSLILQKHSLLKKILAFSIIALLFAAATYTNTGCVKSSGTNGVPVINLPDISNFAIQSVSAFVPGTSATIGIISSSLASGTYTVHFDLGGANIMTGLTATLTMSGTNATFTTPALPNAGNMTVTITSITNSSGESATVVSNNTKTFSDSTGLMTCKINGNSFRATHVTVQVAGNLLTIAGTLWSPLTTISFSDYDYTHVNAAFSYTTDTTLPRGDALYTASGIATGDHFGQLSYTISGQIITGAFSFTNVDGSVISNGAFTGKLP